MHFQSKKWTCDVKELTQRELEAYVTGTKDLGGLPAVIFDGKCVALGLQLGLYLQPQLTADQVPDLPPGQVRFLSDSLAAAIEDCLKVDPLS